MYNTESMNYDVYTCDATNQILLYDSCHFHVIWPILGYRFMCGVQEKIRPVKQNPAGKTEIFLVRFCSSSVIWDLN